MKTTSLKSILMCTSFTDSWMIPIVSVCDIHSCPRINTYISYISLNVDLNFTLFMFRALNYEHKVIITTWHCCYMARMSAWKTFLLEFFWLPDLLYWSLGLCLDTLFTLSRVTFSSGCSIFTVHSSEVSKLYDISRTCCSVTLYLSNSFLLSLLK